MQTIDNRSSYNAIADAWDKNRRQKGVDPCVMELAALLLPGAKVLDIGCGTGYPIDVYLARQGYFLFTGGRHRGDVQGEMFGQPFSYGALDGDTLRRCLADAGLTTVWDREDYADPVTGARDLLVLARKDG